MKKGKSFGGIQGDFHPRLPRHRKAGPWKAGKGGSLHSIRPINRLAPGAIKRLTSKEVLFEASACHILVDQQPVIVLATVADELHEIRMTEFPKIVHLSLENPEILRKTTMQEFQNLEH